MIAKFDLNGFPELRDSRGDGGKSESHIVFYYGFCESRAFIVLYSWMGSGDEGMLSCSNGGDDYKTSVVIIRFYVKKIKTFFFLFQRFHVTLISGLCHPRVTCHPGWEPLGFKQDSLK